MALMDIRGQAIEVGDIVAFVDRTHGGGLPDLCFGRVYALTKAGVTVNYLNNDFSPRLERNLEMMKPVNIRLYPNRFYIVRKA